MGWHGSIYQGDTLESPRASRGEPSRERYRMSTSSASDHIPEI